MEDAMLALSNAPFSILAICVASIFVGYIVVGSALRTLGASANATMICTHLATLAGLAYGFGVY